VGTAASTAPKRTRKRRAEQAGRFASPTFAQRAFWNIQTPTLQPALPLSLLQARTSHTHTYIHTHVLFEHCDCELDLGNPRSFPIANAFLLTGQGRTTLVTLQEGEVMQLYVKWPNCAANSGSIVATIDMETLQRRSRPSRNSSKWYRCPVFIAFNAFFAIVFSVRGHPLYHTWNGVVVLKDKWKIKIYPCLRAFLSLRPWPPYPVRLSNATLQFRPLKAHLV
jgi:hypothetical protein